MSKMIELIATGMSDLLDRVKEIEYDKIRGIEREIKEISQRLEVLEKGYEKLANRKIKIRLDEPSQSSNIVILCKFEEIGLGKFLRLILDKLGVYLDFKIVEDNDDVSFELESYRCVPILREKRKEK